jgi:adenylate cyclase
LSFVNELKRRNVIRIAGLYLVGAWLIVQVASTILPAFDWPGWVLRTVITVLAIGFVPALIFAWAFELTPEGLRRESDVERAESIAPHTGKSLDRIIMVVLALAVGYFGFDKFVLSPQRDAALQLQKTAEVAAARKEGHSEALIESYGDKSIAVLPFVDMSPGKDQEYFSDGIAEELLNLLTKVPQLRVISRASAFSFKGKDIGVPEIAKRLNVAHVLEGSVRKSGNKVRVSAQLVDARSDTQLWSETWDRDLNDIFAVQDEIAAAVVGQLKIQLLGDAPKSKAVKPEAYALFLQARALSNQGTTANYQQSEMLYEQALAIEPDYAAAWTGRSVNYFRMVGAGSLTAEKGYVLARVAVNRAIAIDPGYAPAYAQSGWLTIYQDNDLAAAAEYLKRALALEPTDSFSIGKAAALMYNLGRLDEAIALGEYEVARDPLYAPGHSNLATRYLTAGRLDEAIASYRTVLRLSPGFYGAQAGMGAALLLQGKDEAALDAMRMENIEVERLLGLAMAYHALGDKAESDRALARLIAVYGRDFPGAVAYVMAYRGEVDRAFEWLQKAVQFKDTSLPEAVFLPFFDNIRSDPRWLPFLRKIGRAPEQLAAIKFDVKLPK